MEKKKLKLAFYWAASCGGCEIAVLDINEKILDIVAIADILFWPVAIDVKYKDVEEMPDKHIDVCFFNGGAIIRITSISWIWGTNLPMTLRPKSPSY